MEEHNPNWMAYYIIISSPRTHPETLLIPKKEMQTREQLARENGRGKRHAHSVHVQHLLQAESRGLKTGNHDILLHATNAVHTQRQEEENQTEGAARSLAALLLRHHLKHYD